MKTVRNVLSMTVGSLIYIGLIWIPVIGPIIVGLITGWIRQGTAKNGFTSAIIAGALGSIGLMILIPTAGLIKSSGFEAIVTVFILWIILLWNLVGILLCGLGGAIGSVIFLTHSFFENPRGNAQKHRSDARTFSICPQCGSGNLSEETTCRSCDMDLGHGNQKNSQVG